MGSGVSQGAREKWFWLQREHEFHTPGRSVSPGGLRELREGSRATFRGSPGARFALSGTRSGAFWGSPKATF